MTNRQQAVFETAKFFLIVISISISISLAVVSGYAPWVGIVACALMLVYGALMVYEIKLAQIETRHTKEKN